ncbi:Thiamine-phosphate pyrophosphorylase [Bacteroides coprosuis DSM 18011]|uniref:Thiamine-phosphate synthase n=1 Tax=Bacteroides coprosuis DSM 18011 TaxID=679937 RepID=F3ZUB9_9BACE|nr:MULTISPECIES: thiamine phosphate synthase [Bacteroides]EGJ71364.1 Thiamine-phosphate pyrophosphorylase [Bacteroides coprosuis DSM 18011]
MKKSLDLSLYLVTDPQVAEGNSFLEVIEDAVKGGVTLVQLREKDCSSREFYDKALAIKHLLSSYDVPLIINDRLDIALAVDADGLHIGQEDIPYDVARKILGPDKIIGLSVENKTDALRANKLDIDYIGISPVFSTPTKIDTAPALGLEGSRLINSISKHPSVGIGGIHLQNAASIIASGSDGISVVSAIMMAKDPFRAAQELKQIILKAKDYE